ncbi:hypothetical protein IQ254_13560 [Nodosilinea sp. LEGE 07088]|uniref:hypothetical protein n=1 Tax=Nodosilinea sp. LEGE 07088 TaxID=2777968 RepID=UPI00187E14DB|nr:hypothetical protein [Nodosilinea sp. LEGE 07088]MBE9138200.1 hypothetical protein [Nodosilinea sp. LEGE 07088]
MGKALAYTQVDNALGWGYCCDRPSSGRPDDGALFQINHPISDQSGAELGYETYDSRPLQR